MAAERLNALLHPQTLPPWQLSTSPGFWEDLLHVVTSDERPSGNHHKQLALILLKNTIPKHWDDASHPPDEKIAGGYHKSRPCCGSHPAAQSIRLPAVRASLVAAAVTQPGNFLSAFGVAFSHIVCADFPARWPDLTVVMLSHLESAVPSQQIAAATLLHAVSIRTASKSCAIVF